MRYFATIGLAVLSLLALSLLIPNETAVSAQSAPQRKLAFTLGGGAASTDIYVINSDGTGQTRLTNNGADDRSPAWSPDGTQLLFESTREGGTTNIYRMNADGSNQIPVTASSSPWGNYDPAWSPDGHKIAFVSNRDGIYQADIWVSNTDGNNAIKLTTPQLYNTDSINPVYSTASEPAWSPDGTKIAFTSRRDGNFNLDIYVMNADGTNQTRLTTHAADDRDPTWSPDGTKIAFSTFRDGDAEIYVMNADGTNQTNLTNFPAGNEFQPAWAQDDKIAFGRLSSSNNYIEEIYTMNADGSQQTKLVSNGATSWMPAWQTFSAIPTPTPTPLPPVVYRVTGRILDMSRYNGASTPGVGGVTLQLSGSASATTQTDEGGYYNFFNVPENGSYTVTPLPVGWYFSPTDRTFTTGNGASGFIDRTITLNFDAAPIYLEFSSDINHTNEGTEVSVTVSSSGILRSPATIDYATSDGSALASADYVPASGTLHFAPGQGSKTFTVRINNDDVEEGNETINLTLSNPTGSVARGRQTSIIRINGTAPLRLLTEENSDRAIAVNAVTLLREPFTVTSPFNFSNWDFRTRVTLFAANVDLEPGEPTYGVLVLAEDAQERMIAYQIPVEFLGDVPGQAGLTQITIRLPDELAGKGDVWLKIIRSGRISNRAAIKIN